MRVADARLFIIPFLLCLSGIVIAGCAQTSTRPGPPTAGPIIETLSPYSGPRGSGVTIKGGGFKSTQGTSTVTFNGLPAVVTRWSAKAIDAMAPVDATTGPVVVTVEARRSNEDRIFSVHDFTLSVTPARHAIQPGETATYTVTLEPVNGFNSSVALSVSANLPANTAAIFNPNPVESPYTSTLTIQTSTATPPGLSTPVILGQGGGQAHTNSVTLCLVGTAPVESSFDTRVMAARAADFDITPGSDGSGTPVADGSTREIRNVALTPGTYTLRLPRGGGAEAALLPFTVGCTCDLMLP